MGKEKRNGNKIKIQSINFSFCWINIGSFFFAKKENIFLPFLDITMGSREMFIEKICSFWNICLHIGLTVFLPAKRSFWSPMRHFSYSCSLSSVIFKYFCCFFRFFWRYSSRRWMGKRKFSLILWHLPEIWCWKSFDKWNLCNNLGDKKGEKKIYKNCIFFLLFLVST